MMYVYVPLWGPLRDSRGGPACRELLSQRRRQVTSQPSTESKATDRMGGGEETLNDTALHQAWCT